jgi:hypothetical protein
MAAVVRVFAGLTGFLVKPGAAILGFTTVGFIKPSTDVGCFGRADGVIISPCSSLPLLASYILPFISITFLC